MQLIHQKRNLKAAVMTQGGPKKRTPLAFKGCLHFLDHPVECPETFSPAGIKWQLTGSSI